MMVNSFIEYVVANSVDADLGQYGLHMSIFGDAESAKTFSLFRSI